MKRLGEKEERLMQIVWELKKAFVKEVREKLPEPKPHINTVSTMMKRLYDKGFLKIEDFGSTYRYSAAISKKKYVAKIVKPFLAGMFGNSIKNAVTFFAEEEEITLEELKEIMEMIDKKRK